MVRESSQTKIVTRPATRRLRQLAPWVMRWGHPIMSWGATMVWPLWLLLLRMGHPLRRLPWHHAANAARQVAYVLPLRQLRMVRGSAALAMRRAVSTAVAVARSSGLSQLPRLFNRMGAVGQADLASSWVASRSGSAASCAGQHGLTAARGCGGHRVITIGKATTNINRQNRRRVTRVWRGPSQPLVPVAAPVPESATRVKC